MVSIEQKLFNVEDVRERPAWLSSNRALSLVHLSLSQLWVRRSVHVIVKQPGQRTTGH